MNVETLDSAGGNIDEHGARAGFSGPFGLIRDNAGNLSLADTGNLSSLARGVTLDKQGNLHIADPDHNLIAGTHEFFMTSPRFLVLTESARIEIPSHTAV